MPVVSLVGYTNAGKSSLLNRLTAARVLAEDQLFATLAGLSSTRTTMKSPPSLSSCFLSFTAPVNKESRKQHVLLFTSVKPKVDGIRV